MEQLIIRNEPSSPIRDSTQIYQWKHVAIRQTLYGTGTQLIMFHTRGKATYMSRGMRFPTI